MPKLAYCGYCGREFSLKERAAGESVPYCSAECLEAAAKQDAGVDGHRPEKLLVSGQSPWSK
ncbi:hypothetical protein [Methanoculleus horonobensis]|jgi:hypothetical protein|uniref:hypothetical protein n=1 Tax=Methanoculleus horonobensis TaxID=528314 RepID=UPI00082E081A|nr:hypothetical protein [Methanoculleus horonobensis]MDD3070085.1 hypothetical protein [Methanoculleus horonobensis]MDD4252162.1 hypothetical protein [Methanoculleus horonobensis]